VSDDTPVPIGFRRIAAREKAGWVRRQFDAIAPRYDRMNTLLSFGIHHLWKRRAMAWLDPRPGERILDLCGGTGDLAVAAVRRTGPRGRVTLCDINREMIRVGRAASRRAAERTALDYVEGDAERLPFRDRSFDGVVVGFGIRNLTRMDRGFAEILRILRPGGRLVVLEFSHPADPLFRRIYDLYSFSLMPRLGRRLAGSAEAYAYLAESIREFPDAGTLAGRLRNAGFSEVRYDRLTRGVAALHAGRRPGRHPDRHPDRPQTPGTREPKGPRK
jgi:demethylmenaquinone methyltransferase / 2-methoxy-6-polyprenyl-1,4-benzoquinol methylase